MIQSSSSKNLGITMFKDILQVLPSKDPLNIIQKTEMYSSKFPETQTAQQTIFNLNPKPHMDRLLSARTKQCKELNISCLKQMMCWKIIDFISKI